ncbi:hypothetical protein ACIQLG_06775 [Terribacillus saccharophilus]|uniref:hypothetical protein n=1 Tax=Terribacillus saccharophilus TaxID=361277 RepID=UPI0037FF0A7F
MFIVLLYTTKTAPLLLQHFQTELNAIFTAEGCRQAALQADTYIPILVAALDNLTAYTREELVGMLIVEQLVKLESGRRAILVSTNDSLKQFLRKIGFKSRPAADTSCDTSWAKADIMDLDLRTRPFGDCVLHMMPEEQNKRDSFTVDHTRRILQDIQSPRELSNYCSILKDCCDGQAVQRKVMQSLHNSGGLSGEEQDVLLNSFVRYPNNTVRSRMQYEQSYFLSPPEEGDSKAYRYADIVKRSDTVSRCVASFYVYANRFLSPFLPILSGSSLITTAPSTIFQLLFINI